MNQKTTVNIMADDAAPVDTPTKPSAMTILLLGAYNCVSLSAPPERNAGYTIIARRSYQFSRSISVVLGIYRDEQGLTEYAVWTLNRTTMDYHQGLYTKDAEKAVAAYLERGE